MPKINNHKKFNRTNHKRKMQTNIKHKQQNKFNQKFSEIVIEDQLNESFHQQDRLQDEERTAENIKSLLLLQAFVDECEKSIDTMTKSAGQIESLVVGNLRLLRLQEAMKWNALLAQFDEKKHKLYHKSLEEVKSKYHKFEDQVKKTKYSRALELIQQINKMAPNIIKIQFLRIQVLIKNGDLMKAKKLINKHQDNHPYVYYLQAQIELYFGLLEKSMRILNLGKNIQKQTNKMCSSMLQTIQKSRQLKVEGMASMKSQKYQQAISKFTQILTLDPFNRKLNCMIYSLRSSAYLELNDFNKALEDTNLLLSIQPKSIKGLFQRAKVNVQRGQFEAALKDYQRIYEIDPNVDISDKIFEMQQRQRQSKKKDYYKVLRIQKTASQAQIKKAYKVLALQFHPDKNINKTEAQQLESTRKFTEITQAYGILTDPHKKQLYDNGEMEYEGDQGCQHEGYYFEGQEDDVSLNDSQFMFESNNPLNFGFMHQFSNCFFSTNPGAFFDEQSMQEESEENIIYFEDSPQVRQYNRSARQKPNNRKKKPVISKQRNHYKQNKSSRQNGNNRQSNRDGGKRNKGKGKGKGKGTFNRFDNNRNDW